MSSTGDEADELEDYAEPTASAQAHPKTEPEQDRGEPIPPTEDADSSTGDERPGRFHGPDSSWRFYSQDERALIASLDQAENNDLSIHLYNAHKWSERLRRKDTNGPGSSWRHKQSWIERDEFGRLPFLPDSNWTAWPLKSVDVPRNNENWGVPLQDPGHHLDTYCNRASWTPSSDLEESIKAEILRQAKRQFEQREWTVQDDDLSSPLDDGQNQESSGECGSSAPENSESDEELESSSDGSTPFTSAVKPSFLVDEDPANALTRLTTRHVISELQNVFAGLHHSRVGHRTRQSRSRSRSQCPTPAGSSRRAGAAEESDVGDVAGTSDSVEDEDMQDDDSPPSIGSDAKSRPVRSAQRPSQRHRLGTRDWSEVLGIAALVGWDRAVVDRAARRCAALFGEGMEMRTFPDVSETQAPSEVTRYAADMPPIDAALPPVPMPLRSEDEIFPMIAPSGKDFSCPHKWCPRHEEPYGKRWRLREHLKRKHGHGDDAADRILQ